MFEQIHSVDPDHHLLEEMIEELKAKVETVKVVVEVEANIGVKEEDQHLEAHYNNQHNYIITYSNQKITTYIYSYFLYINT